MRILALETAAKAVSAAVTEDGRVLAAGYQDTGLTHSRTLMPIVEGLLSNTGLKAADMDAIAVSAGPGSFTGVRIGVSAAKGLAWAADKPCVAVSTLAALARNVSFIDGLIVCAMDARRQQVYNALFEARDGALTRLTEDRAIALSDLAEELRSDPRPKTVLCVFGSGGHPLPPGPGAPGEGERRLRGPGGGGRRPGGGAGNGPGAGPRLPAAPAGGETAGGAEGMRNNKEVL